jgi:hypothetical protein
MLKGCSKMYGKKDYKIDEVNFAKAVRLMFGTLSIVAIVAGLWPFLKGINLEVER